MNRTPLGTAGSRTREIALARWRGRWCSGALVVPALAALCLAFPGSARALHAQRSATIRVTATVTNAYTSAGLRPAAAAADAVEPGRHLQRLPVDGVGVLEVEGAVGAQVRLTASGGVGAASVAVGRAGVAPLALAAEPAAARPVRLVQATVAYPGL